MCIFYEDLKFRLPGVPLSREASELRQRVDKQISSLPETLNMAVWEFVGSCGTARCLAGWAQYFADGEVNGLVQERAVEVLELTKDEYLLPFGGDLFHARDEVALELMHELAQVPPGE